VALTAQAQNDFPPFQARYGYAFFMEEKTKKQCSKCGDWKAYKAFRPNPPGWKKKSDGYDGTCRSCRSDYEKERQHMKRLGQAMFGDVHKITGIELCPCDENGKRCVYWNLCKTQEVSCKNFRAWTVDGRKNDQPQVPDEYLDGTKARLEL
jgi:hypothetical protein